MLAAFPPDHDDHDGCVARWPASGVGFRHRGGTAAAPRHHHCGRIVAQPVADPVYDTGGLSVVRPAGAEILALPHRQSYFRGAHVGRLEDEYFSSIYSASDWHVAIGGCAAAFGNPRL